MVGEQQHKINVKPVEYIHNRSSFTFDQFNFNLNEHRIFACGSRCKEILCFAIKLRSYHERHLDDSLIPHYVYVHIFALCSFSLNRFAKQAIDRWRWKKFYEFLSKREKKLNAQPLKTLKTNDHRTLTCVQLSKHDAWIQTYPDVLLC